MLVANFRSRNPNPQITQAGAAESARPSSAGMAIARTGVYVDDYLECETHVLPFHGLSNLLPPPIARPYQLLFSVWNGVDSSTLAGDLQRILSTMRELDDRAHGDDSLHFILFF